MATMCWMSDPEPDLWPPRSRPLPRLVASSVSIDQSHTLRCARARHQSHRTRFAVGDAQRLPFDDANFDRTLSLLILNFVPDPEKALTEMIRVTRPGGTRRRCCLGLCGRDGDAPASFGTRQLPSILAQTRTTSAICDCPEPASWRHCGASICRMSRIQRSRWRLSFPPLRITGLRFCCSRVPAGAHVATLSLDDREQLELRLRQRLLGSRAEGPITLRARAWAVRGIAHSQQPAP